MKLWMAPAGLHVEAGQVEDAKFLSKLHAQSFFHGWHTADFVSYLSDPHQTPAYVACDAKRKVAGFALLRLAGDEAELLTLAVEKKWQGKKIASAIMQAVFEDLRMTKARHFFLEVDEENGPALALYARMGFDKVAERKAYYKKPDGSSATALVMRTALL